MSKEIYTERDFAQVFVKDEVTYVPHYTKVGEYVGPGYSGLRSDPTYSSDELKAHGAKETTTLLWRRPKTKN